MPAWTLRDDGIILAVRVTPRSSREAFAAGTSDHFAARLNAPPVEGAANTALIALVAKTFNVSKRQVVLISGESGRLKRLIVTGDRASLAKIAVSLYGDAP